MIVRGLNLSFIKSIDLFQGTLQNIFINQIHVDSVSILDQLRINTKYVYQMNIYKPIINQYSFYTMLADNNFSIWDNNYN